MRRNRFGLAVLAGAVLFLGACATTVTPQAKLLIQNSYSNAEAFNKHVQAGSASQDAVKAWMNSEVQSWKALNDWAQGTNPTAASTPAVVK